MGGSIPGPLCNLQKKRRFLDDGTMCRCESPLPGATGAELSMWDHATWGKPAADYLRNERWFELRYPNLLEHARGVFIEAVNDWVGLNWGADQYDGPSPRIAVIGQNIYTNREETNQKRIARRKFLAPKTFLLDNHFEGCGDSPQSWIETDTVLGQFAIDIVTPVKISYLQEMVRLQPYSFEWTTEMYVEDTMGVQEHDRVAKLMTTDFRVENLPTRTVKRAKWTIGATGPKPDGD